MLSAKRFAPEEAFFVVAASAAHCLIPANGVLSRVSFLMGRSSCLYSSSNGEIENTENTLKNTFIMIPCKWKSAGSE